MHTEPEGVAVLLERLNRLPAGAMVGRYDLLPLFPNDADLLEIGPAHAPCFKGPNTRYFDVIDSADIRQRVIDLNIEQQYGDDGSRTPEVIDYVSPVADLNIVDRQFDFVFSSHAVEHQVDLISHLNIVGSILKPGGAYVIICPDRRYCFDANRPPSTLGQVIEAHEFKRVRHSIAAVVDSAAYPSHNDGERHWSGDTPPVQEIPFVATFDAVDHWRHAEQHGYYIDRHGWQFTPASLKLIFDFLYKAAFTRLFVTHVFDPPHPANEFVVVMKKTDQEI